MPRPTDSREVSTDTGGVASPAGERIFIYVWIGIVILGYLAYLQGFSASPILCMAMIIPGIVWIAAFFAAIDVPIRRIAGLSAQQYLLLVCILVTTAPASGYALGWLYSANFGLRSRPILQVAEKTRICPRVICYYSIRLKVAEMVPTYHVLDKPRWDRLEVGDSVQVSKAISVWGTVINNIGDVD